MAKKVKFNSEQAMARVAEINETIEALTKERNELEKKLDLTEANKKLGKIIGKWARITGWNDYDENHEDTSHYRICYIEGVDSWFYGNTFNLRVRYITYLQTKKNCKNDTVEIDVGISDAKPQVIRVDDITKIKPLSPERAGQELKAAGQSVIKRIEKMLKAMKKEFK